MCTYNHEIGPRIIDGTFTDVTIEQSDTVTNRAPTWWNDPATDFHIRNSGDDTTRGNWAPFEYLLKY